MNEISRDQIAAMIMAGLVANSNINGKVNLTAEGRSVCVSYDVAAVAMADSLIAELTKPRK